MNIDEFKSFLTQSAPPSSLSPLLHALWFDAKEDWDTAHRIAQDIPTKEGSWLHAYLHRKEGDAGNAAYWYHRAGKPVPSISLEKEWEELFHAFSSSDGED